ncbi:hypothetical protein VTL71DRAFT_4720 [Oculimacula yallundae]|uniref:Nephrocystin 3-like N-terminal domain-containing protein n=1 Tax=Oculimacula yallundae TaxID=86028 RepID=A0ABR4C2R1_9HELO
MRAWNSVVCRADVLPRFLVDALENETLERDRISCLSTLGFENSKKPSKPSPGTCSWIATDPIFKNWYSGQIKTLWIQGKAGSGKSTTMQHLYETEFRKAASKYPKVMVLRFSFFSQSHGPESSMKGLLRSLLHQVISQNKHLAGPAMKAWSVTSSKPDQSVVRFWDDLQELKEILIETLSLGPGRNRLSIYIDALNECEEHGKPWNEDIEFLIDSLTSPDANTKFEARIMVSSQPTPRLIQVLGALEVPTVVLEEHNSDDISTYLNYHVRAFKPLAPEFEKIIKRILSQADGLFLWVVLIWENFLLDQLEKSSIDGEYVSTEYLEAILSKPLERLDKTFRLMLDKVEHSRRSAATVALKLAVCAIRPLTIEEFRYAQAFGSATHNFPDEKSMLTCPDFPLSNEDAIKQIRSRSGGLLVVETRRTDGDLRKTIVRLIHESAKVYLSGLTKTGPIFPGSEPGEDGHVYLSRACTNWLAISDLRWLCMFFGRDVPSFFHAYMLAKEYFYFVEYAFSFWIRHVREAERSTHQSQANFLLTLPVAALSIYHGLGRGTTVDTGWMDFWRAWSTIRGWRDTRENVLGQPGPLCIAVGSKLPLTAIDLVENHVTTVDEAGGFPIQCAFLQESYDMIFLLLQKGAKTRWLAHRASDLSSQALYNPLRIWIASQDEGSMQTEPRRAMTMLLDSGNGFELPHVNEWDLGSALSVAIIEDNVGVIRMLIERGIGHVTFESYLTSGLYALIAFHKGCDHNTIAATVSAVLDPSHSEPHLKKNAIYKCLKLVRWFWETHTSQAEGEESQAETARIKAIAIILFQSQKSLLDEPSGANSDSTTQEAIFQLFLDSYLYDEQYPVPVLVCNQDGPISWPGEQNIFSPDLSPSERRDLLQPFKSPFFEGRSMISARRGDSEEAVEKKPAMFIYL